MLRKLPVAILLIASGALAAMLLSRWPAAEEPASMVATPRARISDPSRRFAAATERGPVDAQASARPVDSVDQRIRQLETRLAEESAERQRLQDQLEELNARLASRSAGAPPPVTPVEPQTDLPPPAEPVDYSKSELERALIAGGLDANRAADLKRESDNLAMAEMYLRDQATREEWLDTPRFEDEMAALAAQRVSIRDELGDDGYDRYLFALGQTNRVRVDDVMADSPAAQAGLLFGDMILRYGDDRIFTPDELVDHTRQGTPGEMVQLVIVRQGELLTVEVPRGPLGLRVDRAQDKPEER